MAKAEKRMTREQRTEWLSMCASLVVVGGICMTSSPTTHIQFDVVFCVAIGICFFVIAGLCRVFVKQSDAERARPCKIIRRLWRADDR